MGGRDSAFTGMGGELDPEESQWYVNQWEGITMLFLLEELLAEDRGAI